MSIACKICIVTKGITTKDLFETQEELIKHIESVHHMPIMLPGETEEQTQERFLKKYPEAATCPECIEAKVRRMQRLRG